MLGERVPDTVLDSLAEDSDRPHRRLMIVSAGHDKAHQVLDATQWELEPSSRSLSTVGVSELQ